MIKRGDKYVVQVGGEGWQLMCYFVRELLEGPGCIGHAKWHLKVVKIPEWRNYHSFEISAGSTEI